MTIEELQSICNSFKGVTTDIKWEDHLCFNVGKKIFLITSLDTIPPTASFKVTEEAFDQLVERDGISQARYFAKRQWATVDDISRLTHSEWEEYISMSYGLVASKLPGKLRKELEI
jgi:predicted DNA-binding protein (MmcQ/YjbR family)